MDMLSTDAPRVIRATVLSEAGNAASAMTGVPLAWGMDKPGIVALAVAEDTASVTIAPLAAGTVLVMATATRADGRQIQQFCSVTVVVPQPAEIVLSPG